jgi:hypothetical protein
VRAAKPKRAMRGQGDDEKVSLAFPSLNVNARVDADATARSGVSATPSATAPGDTDDEPHVAAIALVHGHLASPRAGATLFGPRA